MSGSAAPGGAAFGGAAVSGGAFGPTASEQALWLAVKKQSEAIEQTSKQVARMVALFENGGKPADNDKAADDNEPTDADKPVDDKADTDAEMVDTTKTEAAKKEETKE